MSNIVKYGEIQALELQYWHDSISSTLQYFRVFTNIIYAIQGLSKSGRTSAEAQSMRFESHFKSYFGNVKAFNLKKIKIIAEPVAAMAGGGLRLGGDGRRIP